MRRTRAARGAVVGVRRVVGAVGVVAGERRQVDHESHVGALAAGRDGRSGVEEVAHHVGECVGPALCGRARRLLGVVGICARARRQGREQDLAALGV